MFSIELSPHISRGRRTLAADKSIDTSTSFR
jgi:hypothetical protein